MSYNSQRKQPVTPAKKSQPAKKSSVQASRHSFPDFDFDEEEDEYQGINPLLDVDFTDLELESQEEFTYKEEEDIYLEDDDDEDFDDEEE
jgi:hypothetical protein